MSIDNQEVFYFLAHPRGDRSKITVIDLSYCVSYERSDWCEVNELDFTCLKEAKAYARLLAVKYNLTYELFESRYDSSTNEKVYLYL